MTLRFNKAIEKISNILRISEEEHRQFTDDSIIIAEKIEEVLRTSESIFANTFLNFKATAIFTKDTRFDLPDDFDLFLILKMPIDMKPVYGADIFKTLYLSSKAQHPLVKNGLININRLEFLLRSNLDQAISEIKFVACTNNKIYDLQYESHQSQILFPLHSIIATERVLEGPAPKITFHFAAVFPMPRNAEQNGEDGQDAGDGDDDSDGDKIASVVCPRLTILSDNLSEFYAKPYTWQSLSIANKKSAANLLRLYFALIRQEDRALNLNNVLFISSLRISRARDEPIKYNKKPFATMFLEDLQKDIMEDYNFLLPKPLAYPHMPGKITTLKKFRRRNKVKMDDLYKLFGIQK